MTIIYQQCAKLTKEIRLLKDTKDETLEEQDIRLREVKQFHKVIDEMLVDIIEENAEIRIILQTYFQQVIQHLLLNIFLKHFMKIKTFMTFIMK